jgi:RND family efflux transporter MFP subunit
MFLKKLKVGVAVVLALAGVLLAGGGLAWQHQAGGAEAATGPEPAKEKAAAVTVRRPERREVAPYEVFTGRLVEAQAVALRPQVSGVLKKVHLKLGADVKKGDLLYEIDPAPYQAALDVAEANVKAADEQFKEASAQMDRLLDMVRQAIMPKESLDRARAAVTAAKETLGARRAAAARARLELQATRGLSPVDGRIAERNASVGEVVGGADAAPLARIIVLDSVVVRFDMDERNYLRYQRLLRAGEIKGTGHPLRVALADEKDFPHEGTLSSFATSVNPETGTIHGHGRLPNPKKLFLPGMFARVRVPFGKPRPVLEVPDEAVLADGGKRYLLVVGPGNVVERRAVKLGQSNGDLRVIAEGLRPDDWVVVGGVQQVRVGDRIEGSALP